jgi:ADP-ribose pyrophosphatase
VPDPTEIDPGQAIDDLNETVVASRVIHEGRYLTFRVDTIERTDGSRAERDVVGHPGAVAILAVDPDGEVLLVRQFRVPAGRVLLEIPAGTLDIDDATGAVEDHALAARRELEEETGYRADTWRQLASFWTAPGFATELMHLWLATDLRPADGERLGPDEDEHLRLERMPLRDAVAAVERGEIADAKSIVGLLWLDRLSGAGVTDAVPRPAGIASTGTPGTASVAGDVVRLTYRLGLSEYVGAVALLTRHSRGLQAFGSVIAVIGLLAFFIGADTLTWLPPVFFGLAVVSGLFMVPIAWIGLRRRRELVEEPMTVVADASGITTTASYGQSHAGWQLYTRVREVGDWFFLDTGAGANHLIPKRAFSPEDLATFRRLIADAGFGMDGRRKPPTV